MLLVKQKSLVENTTKLVGGAAVAGFGFSMGRDGYRHVKKDPGSALGVVLFFSVIVLAVTGLYNAGLWLSRNYRTLFRSIISRIWAVMFLVPSFYISSFVFKYPAAMIFGFSGVTVNEGTLYWDPSRLGSQWLSFFNGSDYETSLSRLAIGICGVVFVSGVVAGLSQRRKRSRVWANEKANYEFLVSNNLVEREDGCIEDTDSGENFRVDFLGKDRITLFPLGRRGKRAYIYLDDGRYIRFTGLQAKMS
jgi:hypothetical protein